MEKKTGHSPKYARRTFSHGSSIEKMLRTKDVTISGDLCIFRTLYEYLFHFGKMDHNPLQRHSLNLFAGQQQKPITSQKISSIRSYIRHLQLRQVDGSEGFPIAYAPRALHPYYAPPQVLEPEEVKRILNCINKRSVLGFRDFLLYSMLYRLGLRLGEALGLNFKDIDLENQLITIHVKGRRQWKLPLVSDLPYLMEKWLYLRNKLWNAKTNKALFISKKGNRLSARTAQDNFLKDYHTFTTP